MLPISTTAGGAYDKVQVYILCSSLQLACSLFFYSDLLISILLSPPPCMHSHWVDRYLTLDTPNTIPNGIGHVVNNNVEHKGKAQW
jgi:hypothetical protein